MTEDILERAKDLRHYLAHKAEWQDESVIVQELIAEVERLRSFRGRIARILGQSPSDCDDLLIVGLDSRIILAKRLTARIKELEAEVEAKNKQIKELQDIIDKPPEDADWVADYHLLQSALDGPIIDAARKWHAAYRKAQNSNLMRAKEVERLRSQLEESQIKYGVDIASTDLHWQDEITAKDARIKELESEITAWVADRDSWIGRYEAVREEKDARIADQEAYIERLEAAFLGATKEIVYAIHEGRDAPEGEDVYAEKVAREALERIKNGND